MDCIVCYGRNSNQNQNQIYKDDLIWNFDDERKESDDILKNRRQ